MEWELAPRNPILEPEPELGEGPNNSDPDLVEFQGRTLVYYADGNQQSWPEAFAHVKLAVFDGAMGEFFRWCFGEAE